MGVFWHCLTIFCVAVLAVQSMRYQGRWITACHCLGMSSRDDVSSVLDRIHRLRQIEDAYSVLAQRSRELEVRTLKLERNLAMYRRLEDERRLEG